jgi:heme/copper-type cytochrome/quinol oxidase subunit 2
MNSKIVLSILAVGIIGVVGVYAYQSSQVSLVDDKESKIAEVSEKKGAPAPSEPAAADSNVKEYTMTSFVKVVDGKYFPQFSLKEITVNKGDKVRIKITVTSGMHDFKIDEYNIYADTQSNKEYVVEFTADKAGDFVYYCTKPGHREKGQWGTLKVLDK